MLCLRNMEKKVASDRQVTLQPSTRRSAVSGEEIFRMKIRASVLALVVTSITLTLLGCNDAKLVNGAKCDPNATAAPVSNATPSMPVIRPIAHHFVPSTAAFTQSTAADLLTAMDADPAGFSNLAVTGDAKQYTVFNTLGAILPSAGTSFAWLSSG